MATAPGTQAGRSAGLASRRAYLPGAAGVAYLVAWVAGLSEWPVNLPLNATAAQTTASFAAHPAQAVIQFLLVEGIAGLLLGVVLGYAVLPLVRPSAALRVKGATPRATVAAVLGAVAVAMSLTQCVVGFLAASAATAHDVTRCGDLSNLVNQLDGVKMIAIAGTAAVLATLGGTGLALPRWLRIGAVPLGIALVASGYSYLALWQPLAWTAFVSGTLLLVWVTGLGITLTVQAKSRDTAV